MKSLFKYIFATFAKLSILAFLKRLNYKSSTHPILRNKAWLSKLCISFNQVTTRLKLKFKVRLSDRNIEHLDIQPKPTIKIDEMAKTAIIFEEALQDGLAK